MKLKLKPLLLAGLLATTGLSAMAQTPPPPAAPGATAPAHPQRGERRFDPARMQQRIDRHFAELKTKLQITPQQEGAWSAFVAGTRPQMGERPRFDRAEFDKLTTPQRIDRMREMHDRRAAEMNKRADAVKTFYAALTPPQQKAFDLLSQHFGHGGRHGGQHGGWNHGPRGGEGRPMGPHGHGGPDMPAPAR
ncbi:MAG: Spy/CpxP family protein refolding chaperone [Pseudomonadota bacterium]